MIPIEFVFAGVQVNDDVFAIVLRFEFLAKAFVIEASAALRELIGR